MGEHYQTLGLARDASKSDVKNAYFRLAHRYHPDHHSQADATARGEAARRFREAKAAYDVLSDDCRRAEYDRQLRRSSSSSSSCNRQGGSSSSSSGYKHSGSSSSSSSSAHGNWGGHAGGSWTRKRPPKKGGGGGLLTMLFWYWVIFASPTEDEKPERKKKENTRIQIRSPPTNTPEQKEKEDGRIQIAEYRSPPTNTPRAMVSALDMRNELSKKSWRMKNVEGKIFFDKRKHINEEGN